jgi:agmatine/peptidylarginine deiminase
MNTDIPHLKLLPEWTEHEAIILAWPDEYTDWAPWLAEVQQVYITIIEQLNRHQIPVVLLARPTQIEQCQQHFEAKEAKVLLVEADYNDTWVRDYAFLTCKQGNDLVPIEYQFNGWGGKFDAQKDNRVNQGFLASLCKNTLISYPLIAEGGAIEIDEQGVILSTASCLFNPKRNGNITASQYARNFANQMGASQLIILNHGHLSGDDTDGHIDTLVRYTPQQGLVIQSCFNRPTDSHYAGLTALVDECKHVLPRHSIFELPLPQIINENGERLPASYANYLIANKILLLPTYRQPEDNLAIDIVGRAYPEHKVIPIDCSPLVKQFGSLHCISMQVPTGTFKQSVINQMHKGVSVYVQ